MAILMGTSGPDNFMGTPEADTMFGAGGNDTINGNIGNDKIYGELGNDSLRGSAGLDSMYGGEGNDTLDASGEGNDYLAGESGNDVYQLVRFGSFVVEGFNQGIDTIQFPLNYTLPPNVENLVLTEATNINGTGNELYNKITGNSGNNTLSGLVGEDTLNGGGGNDTLSGGWGRDQYLFDTPLAAAGVDTITDFSVSDDRIVLDKTVFAALETLAGNPLLEEDYSVIDVAAAEEFSAAGNSFNEIVYNRLTGNLFYNTNNATVGLGVGGGRFATITFAPFNLYNTHFVAIP
jgi:Ca2+-binding RTX toxin-like protein